MFTGMCTCAQALWMCVCLWMLQMNVKEFFLIVLHLNFWGMSLVEPGAYWFDEARGPGRSRDPVASMSLTGELQVCTVSLHRVGSQDWTQSLRLGQLQVYYWLSSIIRPLEKRFSFISKDWVKTFQKIRMLTSVSIRFKGLSEWGSVLSFKLLRSVVEDDGWNHMFSQ